MDFVIMENISRMNNKKNHKVTFDMKGSTFRRYTSLQKQFWNNKIDCPGVLKDLNFVEISQSVGSKLINLSEDTCEELIDNFAADSGFLAEQGLMDYSCLLVVESSVTEINQHYHWGIIDYLQEWTLAKKIERLYKSVVYRTD